MEPAVDEATQDSCATAEGGRFRPKPRPRPRAIKKKLANDGSHGSNASRGNLGNANEAGSLASHVDSHNPTLEISANPTSLDKTSDIAPLPRADEAGKPTHSRKRKQLSDEVEGEPDESTATPTKKRRRAAKISTQPTVTEGSGEANTSPLAGTDQDPNSVDTRGGNVGPLGTAEFTRGKGKGRGRGYGMTQGRGRGRGRGKVATPATGRSATSPSASSNSNDRFDALQPADANALATFTVPDAPSQTSEEGSAPTPSISQAIYQPQAKRPAEGSRRQPPRIARKSRVVDATDVDG